MITRVWHGRTSLDRADHYLQFLLHEGTKEYLQTKGNLSVKVWQRKEEDCCHFWTVTEWAGISAIKNFAGDDYEKAKYYPQDQGVLLEFEEKVSHYETYSVSLPG
ncbi:MAG: antibiotic biosynthesis monooxygenase [Mucilaginibacter sp.]|nr:antibiotic biosynthesis monooxygenase [Mucilaginibacter sp.]